MTQTLNYATTRYQFEILLFSYKRRTKHIGEPEFAHRWSRSGMGTFGPHQNFR